MAARPAFSTSGMVVPAWLLTTFPRLIIEPSDRWSSLRKWYRQNTRSRH